MEASEVLLLCGSVLAQALISFGIPNLFFILDEAYGRGYLCNA
jgi:hypothetical protein